MARRRFAGFLFLVVAPVAAAACVGEAPNNPPADSGGGDIGSPLDGAGPDGGASEAGDSSVSTWCTGRPEKFCWDFDRGVYDDGWTRKELLGSVTKSTDAKSPPTSMLSMLLPGTVTQLNPAFATLTRPITSKVTTTRHAVDYKLLQSGSDAGADASVDAGAGLAFRILSVVVAPGVAATLSANDSGLLLEIAGVQLSYSFGSPPATNTWTRLEYVITWGANGTGAAQVFVDGTSVFATTGISTLATNTVTSGLIATVGSAVLSGTLTSNARALFDNMTVDY